MSRSRPFASLPSTRGLGTLIVAFAVVGSALSTPPVALAQFGGQSAVAQEIKIKSPVASQVFQRNVNGRTVIPVALDEVPDFKAPAVATALAAAAAASPAPARSPRPSPRPRLAPEREPGHSSAPAKLLIITGDHGHDWKATTQSLREILSPGGKIAVDVTTTPAKDLTDANLARYDVLLLNYKDTPGGAPETKWSDANKAAILKAIRDGKGLVVFHFASSAFTRPNWVEFEKAIAGGWRNQGFHGPPHEYTVKKTVAQHPISEGLPAQFQHTIDELYQNSVMVPGNVVLATAYSDPQKPRGTGKDEPVIWVNTYGKGRVLRQRPGPRRQGHVRPQLPRLVASGCDLGGDGKRRASGEPGAEGPAASPIRVSRQGQAPHS